MLSESPRIVNSFKKTYQVQLFLNAVSTPGAKSIFLPDTARSQIQGKGQMQPPLHRQPGDSFFCLPVNCKNGREIVSQVKHDITEYPSEFLMPRLKNPRTKRITRIVRNMCATCNHGEHPHLE